MALYDNKYWLLTYIRNSFISADDTGMCEIVMSGENFPKLFYQRALKEKKRLLEQRQQEANLSSISEDPLSYLQKEIVTEYDPYPEMEESDEEDLMNESYSRYEDFGSNRQRTNTALWLEKKAQAMKKAAKIKNITWENTNTPLLLLEQRMALFPRKIIEPKKSKEKVKSLLTYQLEEFPNLPQRQYVEFAKFDGAAQVGLPTKCFKIFMTTLSESHQNYPIKINILANAKINELIGFTCYKYSVEHPEISLESVGKYGLAIADDDGSIDGAFPCLDNNEPCSKFGFTCLGLIDLKSHNPPPTTSIYMPEDGRFNSAFQMVYPKQTDSGQSHNYGSRHNTGGSGTSEAVLSAIQAVNEDNKAMNREEDKIQSHIIATEAPQYKAYKVQLLHKMRTNTPVQLGISLDKVEVEPLMSGGNKFWPRTKYFLHSIDTVAWCQILESKSNKSTFRLVYSRGNAASNADRSFQDTIGFFHPNSSYKHHDFECEQDTAKQIVEKVNRILDLRNSPCRREYKTAKEKKTQTRRSFQTPKNISCS